MLVDAARALGAHALRAARPPLMMASQVDVFGDPIQITVGGNLVEAKASNFPDVLEGPASYSKATITPFADFGSIVFAPMEPNDAIAAVFIGIALMLGPDFLLAPTGLISDDNGIRPGYALERVVGGVIDAEAPWLKDRDEGLQSDAPLSVRLPIFALFVAAGLLVNRLLLVALEDSSFVISLGICSCIGGGLLEVIRKPLPTRAERDLERRLADEFLLFSTDRLAVGGRCHESDIVRAFRQYYPRYRYADMERSTDGVSLSDASITASVRRWNIAMGRPAERTSTGYWKGISVAAGVGGATTKGKAAGSSSSSNEVEVTSWQQDATGS